jgi:hypothetical protein
MKYEGYFSNVWFTVVFVTPLLALIYYVSDKNSFIAFNLSGLALYLYFLPISLLVFIPTVLLHYQVYRKIEKARLSSFKTRALFVLSAILVFAAVVVLFRLLSGVSSFFLFPLYPFYLTPVIVLYVATITICSLIYKIKTEEVQD